MKVTLVDNPTKSVQEQERLFQEQFDREQAELAAQKAADDAAALEAQNQPIVDIVPEVELREEDVLSYMGKRFGKQISSFDELMAERTKEELPEDVAAFMKYKTETGRGFEDFVKLRKDFDALDPQDLVKEYLSATNSGLDRDDIETMMDEYQYDEDIDDEQDVRKKKLARKKVINEAKKFFNAQKEQYKMPIESMGQSKAREDEEEYQGFKKYVESAKTIEEENVRKRKWFEQKTEEVFGQEFKGFEFNINDRKLVFNPASASELKTRQSNPGNFINKFLDENGLIKDTVGYHKSLAAAMDTERFAKFFYEQGLSDGMDGTLKTIKNVNMTERRAPEITKNISGMVAKDLTIDNGNKLRIKSVKTIR
jgi:hypothetical protein